MWGVSGWGSRLAGAKGDGVIYGRGGVVFFEVVVLAEEAEVGVLEAALVAVEEGEGVVGGGGAEDVG